MNEDEPVVEWYNKLVPSNIRWEEPDHEMTIGHDVRKMIEEHTGRLVAEEDRRPLSAVAEVAGELGTGRAQVTQEDKDEAMLELVVMIEQLASASIAYRIERQLATIKKALNKMNEQPLWEEE